MQGERQPADRRMQSCDAEMRGRLRSIFSVGKVTGPISVPPIASNLFALQKHHSFITVAMSGGLQYRPARCSGWSRILGECERFVQDIQRERFYRTFSYNLILPSVEYRYFQTSAEYVYVISILTRMGFFFSALKIVTIIVWKLKHHLSLCLAASFFYC